LYRVGSEERKGDPKPEGISYGFSAGPMTLCYSPARSFRLTEKCKLFEDKRVAYRLLGDAVIILHFLWILFILFGFFIGIKYGRLIWVHLGGLVFTLILNIGGWFCPLTYLENHLYSLYNPQLTYAGSFIGQYLQKLIYLDVAEDFLRIAAVIWVTINLGGYVLLFKKRKSVYR